MRTMGLRACCVGVMLVLTACASEQTRTENRNAARVNTQLGISYAERGLYDLALEKLHRAIKLDESLAPAHVAAAFVYQKTGDARKAERHYRRALELDNEDPSLKNNFGVFLCGQSRGLEAELHVLAHAETERGDLAAVGPEQELAPDLHARMPVIFDDVGGGVGHGGSLNVPMRRMRRRIEPSKWVSCRR